MEDYLGQLCLALGMVDRGVGRNARLLSGAFAADPTFGDPTTAVYFGDTPVTGLIFLSVAAQISSLLI